MITVDINQNRRIARLAQLKRELTESRTLDTTVETLQRAFFDVESSVASILLTTAGLPPGHYRVLRAELHDESPSARPGAEAGVLRCGGTIAAIIASGQPRLLDYVDWAHDPYFRQTLGEYSSVLAVPLQGQRLPMDWAILLKRSPDVFTERELEEAIERATLAGALLENQLLVEELTRAHEQIDHDAQHVGQLQRALLPASLPRIAGLEIATSYQPSGRAGGDLYDFFPLEQLKASGGDRHTANATSPSRWCVFIGDASGHGLAAAVVMAIVQAVLRAHPENIGGPAALLMHANRQLCDKQLGGFFTAFLGVYEPSARRLTYANAGHPAPLVKRLADGSILALDAAGGYPLGIDQNETFNEAAVQLERGDTVLLFSDGITESRNDRDEMFEQTRVSRIVRGVSGAPIELIERLVAAVRAHRGAQAALDDETLVAARVL